MLLENLERPLKNLVHFLQQHAKTFSECVHERVNQHRIYVLVETNQEMNGHLLTVKRSKHLFVTSILLNLLAFPPTL